MNVCARRLILPVVLTVLGVLAFASAPALAAPLEAYVTEVTSDSATVHAVLDPEGSATTYRFEYGPSGTYGSQTPEESAGEGSAPVSVEAQLQGLGAASGYHFRVVATNVAHGTSESEDHTFTTQSDIGEFALPDGRQYEMVTPPAKEGALIYAQNAVGGSATQASVSGNAIADIVSQPTEAEPKGYSEQVTVLSVRGTGGWSSQDVSGPHTKVGSILGTDEGGESGPFSEDLSHSITQQWGEFTPLSPEASEFTPYLRTNFFNDNVDERCNGSYLTAASCFQPLVTKANTPQGEPFGEEISGLCPRYKCGPRFIDGTPDLSHIVIHTPVRLTSSLPGGWSGDYEWTDGRLQALPGRFAVFGAKAISNNGERVILNNNVEHESNPEYNSLELFETASDEIVPIATNNLGCKGEVECNYMFQGASSDDSRIFFLDFERLTANSGATGSSLFEGKPDLYECEIIEVAGKHQCKISDLTPPPMPGGESADVRNVLGVSDDGSYVYFAAAGALTPGSANNGNCEYAARGGGSEAFEGCNIYVRHDGVTRLISPGWTEAISDEYYNDYSRVSPNGRWLAFISTKGLTGYDTRDASSGQPDNEVYLYHAEVSPAGQLEPGKLTCASCDPTGARPVGVSSYEGNKEVWTAASIPGQAFIKNLGTYRDPLYQARYLSDSGRLFFDSSDPLVPQDVNGTEDVYEYEPEGVPTGEHACSARSAGGSEVFRAAHVFDVNGVGGEEGAGCVALISSGTSSERSSFLDASESGGDVFFLTLSKLVPQDFDSALDVYDAHECTSGSPCTTTAVTTPPPCSTEASCKPSPAPQPSVYGPPSSATFNGPGNIAAGGTPLSKKVVKSAKCKTGFAEDKKGKCVKKKSKPKKKTKAKKTDRRASR